MEKLHSLQIEKAGRKTLTPLKEGALKNAQFVWKPSPALLCPSFQIGGWSCIITMLTWDNQTQNGNNLMELCYMHLLLALKRWREPYAAVLIHGSDGMDYKRTQWSILPYYGCYLKVALTDCFLPGGTMCFYRRGRWVGMAAYAFSSALLRIGLHWIKANPKVEENDFDLYILVGRAFWTMRNAFKCDF